jgi:hypothetical protein
MKNGMLTLILSSCFVGLPVLGGCDREISSETKVKETDDKITRTEKKVEEKPDGSIEKTTEKKTIEK